jgi:hypothetical protein
MAEERQTFQVDDARLLFRNFSGKEGQYNKEGERSFSVVLTPTVAEQMIEDGWNVKYLSSRDEEEEDTPIIQVSVRFDIRPPRVVLITDSGRTQLDEDTIAALDWVDIKVADLIARGYQWSVNGKSGTKAYLQSLFITIEEDALEKKYGINDSTD